MKIKPDTKIIDLATSELLTKLSHAELLVYIKLVAHTATAGRRFKIMNCDLPIHERNAPRALKSLEKRGLLKLSYDEYKMRTIEMS